MTQHPTGEQHNTPYNHIGDGTIAPIATLPHELLAQAGCAILTVDTYGRIVAPSPSGDALLTHQAGQLVGHHLADDIETEWRETHLNGAMPFIVYMLQEAHDVLPFTIEQQVRWLKLTIMPDNQSVHQSSQTTQPRYTIFVQDVTHYETASNDTIATDSHINEEELRLRTRAIEASPSGIFILDARLPSMPLIYVNPAFEKMTGYNAAEVIGRDWWFLWNSAQPAPDTGSYKQSAMLADIRYAMNQGESRNVTLQNYRQNGESFWNDLHLAPLHDGNSNLTHYIGISNDVTDKIHEEHRIQGILRTIPDTLFVMNRDGIITDYYISDENAPLETLLESAQDLVGQHLSHSGLAADIVEIILSYVKAAFETGTMQIFEYPLFLDDFVAHYEARIIALENGDAMALVRDITVLKQVQEELSKHIEDLTLLRQVERELTEQLNINYVIQLALDSAMRLAKADSGFLVLIDNLNGQATLRPEAIIGNYELLTLESALYDPSGIYQQILQDQTPQLISNVQEQSAYQSLIERTEAVMILPLLSQETMIGLMVLETRNRSRFTGDIFHFIRLLTSRVATLIDNARLHRKTQQQLDELQQLYDKVSNLEQLKTDMIRMASHDLKNPLAAVMGYLEMLSWESAKALDETGQGYLRNISNAAQHMQRITTSILSLERIEQMAKTPTDQQVGLRKVISKAVEENKPYADEKSHTLVLELPDEDVLILGDHVQLHEALSNLISNAIKYTADNGRIIVSLEREILADGDNEGNHIENAVIKVIDNGYGIPKEDQAGLFNPFYRVRTEETEDIEGTGIGLHLVKNVIERHGGEMIFSSVYGEGSTFGFRIPALPNPRATP